jgi:hypothetical protein
MIREDIRMMILLRLVLVKNISNDQECGVTIGTDIGGHLVLVSGNHCQKCGGGIDAFENIQVKDLLEGAQYESVNYFKPRFHPIDWDITHQLKPQIMVVVVPCSMKFSITCTPSRDVQCLMNAVYPWIGNSAEITLANARIRQHNIEKTRVIVETTTNKHNIYPGLPFFDDRGMLLGVTIAVENAYNCKRVTLLFKYICNGSINNATLNQKSVPSASITKNSDRVFGRCNCYFFKKPY